MHSHSGFIDLIEEITFNLTLFPVYLTVFEPNVESGTCYNSSAFFAEKVASTIVGCTNDSHADQKNLCMFDSLFFNAKR